MACREYEDELRELAAETLAPGRETRVRAHLAECAACREVFEAERHLFPTVDEALRREMNAPAPASLGARIRLAREAETTKLRGAWWRWATAGTAVAAAIVLMVVLRGREVQRVPQAPMPVGTQQATRGDVAAPEMASAKEQPRVIQAQGPSRAGVRPVREEPEVILPGGEEQALAEWVAERDRRRARVKIEAVTVAFDAPLEIAPLEVKPLAEEPQ